MYPFNKPFKPTYLFIHEFTFYFIIQMPLPVFLHEHLLVGRGSYKMGFERNLNTEGNDGQPINRIESEILIDRNSLIISQNFSVNVMVGAEQNLVIEETEMMDEENENNPFSNTSDEDETLEEVVVQKDYTLIYSAPSETFRKPLLITIIASNLSENDVLVSIEDEEDAIVEEIVPAHSELALTAQNAMYIRALALVPSQVKFFISVFHPTSPF